MSAKKLIKNYERIAKERLNELGITEKPRTHSEWRSSPPVDRPALTKEQKEKIREDETAKALFDVIKYCELCNIYAESGDFDDYTQAFERLTEARILASIEKYDQQKAKQTGQQKKGRRGVLSEAVDEILNNGAKNSAEVIDRLASLSFIQEVDREDKKIYYLENGKEKTVKFTRIPNLMAELRKKD